MVSIHKLFTNVPDYESCDRRGRGFGLNVRHVQIHQSFTAGTAVFFDQTDTDLTRRRVFTGIHTRQTETLCLWWSVIQTSLYHLVLVNSLWPWSSASLHRSLAPLLSSAVIACQINILLCSKAQKLCQHSVIFLSIFFSACLYITTTAPPLVSLILNALINFPCSFFFTPCLFHVLSLFSTPAPLTAPPHRLLQPCCLSSSEPCPLPGDDNISLCFWQSVSKCVFVLLTLNVAS